MTPADKEQRPLVRRLGLAALVALGVVALGVELIPMERSVRIDGSTVACREVIVIGARESGSPAGTQRNFGFTGAAVLATLTSELGGQRSITPFGLSYPALSTDTIFNDYEAYFGGVDFGVQKLIDATERIVSSCRSWIVLAGYSQGALVIRKALPQMSSVARSRIAGVALLGDPARSSKDGAIRRGESEASSAGLYEAVESVSPVPPLKGPTWSWCNRGDAICAAEPSQLLGMALQASIEGGATTPHGRYRFDGSTEAAGVAMATHLLELPKRPSR
jgi:Cutinase